MSLPPNLDAFLECARQVIIAESVAVRGAVDSVDQSFVEAARVLLTCSGKVLITGSVIVLGNNGKARVQNFLSPDHQTNPSKNKLSMQSSWLCRPLRRLALAWLLVSGLGTVSAKEYQF